MAQMRNTPPCKQLVFLLFPHAIKFLVSFSSGPASISVCSVCGVSLGKCSYALHVGCPTRPDQTHAEENMSIPSRPGIRYRALVRAVDHIELA